MTRMIRRGFLVGLALILPASLHGQTLEDYDYENLTFRGVGFYWGYIWPSKVDQTSLYSVRFDLGFLGPAVRIMPGLSYWSSQMKTAELERLALKLSDLPPIRQQGVVVQASDLGVVDWSDLSINLDTHVVWTAPRNVITYTGVGVGLHVLNGRGDVIGDTFIEDLLDTTTAGLAVMGGLEYEPFPQFRMYGEARYTLASDVRYPGFRVGGAFMLPVRGNALTAPQGGR
jgi:hypothetical protein